MTNLTTKGTVQVALVGGRQAPNVIGALVLRPSRIELVASADASNNILSLLGSLAGIESLSLSAEKEDLEREAKNAKVVDAYNFEATVDACRLICQQYANHIIDFNLTCSTKVMGIAAYEVARQHNNARAFYVDTRNSRILWLEGKGQESSTPFQLSIEEYLGAYGRKPQAQFKFDSLSFSEEQAIKAAEILANSASESGRILRQIRRIRGSCPREVIISSFTSQEKSWIDQLIAIKIINKGTEKGAFIVRTNEDKDFLTGGWLELYVYCEASKQKGQNSKPLFSESSFNLEIPSTTTTTKREIDVACLYQAQLIHCSCKTGRDAFDSANLDELRAVSSLIGARFCSRVYITQKFIENYQGKDSFLNHAKQHEIVVVTGETLTKVGEILKKQATKPDYWRI